MNNELRLKCSCKLSDIMVSNINNKYTFFDVYFTGTVSVKDIEYIIKHINSMSFSYHQETYRYVRQNFKKDIEEFLKTIINDVQFIISKKDNNKPKNIKINKKKFNNKLTNFNYNSIEIFNDKISRDISKTLEIPLVLFKHKRNDFIHRIKRDYTFHDNIFNIYSEQKTEFNILKQEKDVTLTSGLSLCHFFDVYAKNSNYHNIFYDAFNLINITTEYLNNIHKKDKYYKSFTGIEFNYKGSDFLFVSDVNYDIRFNEHIL